MTTPLVTANDDNLLYWQQQRNNNNQVQQQQQQSNQVTDSVTPLLQPQQNLQQQQQTISDIGQQATQGAIGAAQTQAAQDEQARRDEFEKQQAQATANLQKQQADFQTQMQQKYTDLFNQQQQAQTAQWTKYNNSLSTYQTQMQAYGTNTQVTNYSGSAVQIAQLARNAGFSEAVVPQVVAIALAESGGKANAINNANSNGTSDYGLMQINSVHSNLLKNANWSDPQQNMNMAFQIYKSAGNSFTPWSTFNNGAAAKYMTTARQAAQAVQQVQVKPFVASTATGLRAAIVQDAKQYLGIPYVWGGTNLSKGVDCSGLVQSVYKQLGIALPRTADQQAHAGIKTSISNLQPGDLVAWQGGYRGPNYVGHIAIYIGNGQIIESPDVGKTVRIRSIGKNENVFGVHLTNLDPAAKAAGFGAGAGGKGPMAR